MTETLVAPARPEIPQVDPGFELMERGFVETTKGRGPVEDERMLAENYGLNGKLVARLDLGDPTRIIKASSTERLHVIDLGENHSGALDRHREMHVRPDQRYVIVTGRFLEGRRWAPNDQPHTPNPSYGWNTFAAGQKIEIGRDTVKHWFRADDNPEISKNHVEVEFGAEAVEFTDKSLNGAQIKLGAVRGRHRGEEMSVDKERDMMLEELGDARHVALSGYPARELAKRNGSNQVHTNGYFEGLGNADFNLVIDELSQGVMQRLGIDLSTDARSIQPEHMVALMESVVPGTPTWIAFNRVFRQLPNGREVAYNFYGRNAGHFAENTAKGIQSLQVDEFGSDKEAEIMGTLHRDQDFIGWRIEASYDGKYGSDTTRRREIDIRFLHEDYLSEVKRLGVFKDDGTFNDNAHGIVKAKAFFSNIRSNYYANTPQDEAARRILYDNPRMLERIQDDLVNVQRPPERMMHQPHRYKRVGRFLSGLALRRHR